MVLATPLASLSLCVFISKMELDPFSVLVSILCVSGAVLGSGSRGQGKTGKRMVFLGRHSHAREWGWGIPTSKHEPDNFQIVAKAMKKIMQVGGGF